MRLFDLQRTLSSGCGGRNGGSTPENSNDPTGRDFEGVEAYLETN